MLIVILQILNEEGENMQKFIEFLKYLVRVVKYAKDSLQGNGKFSSKYIFEDRRKNSSKMLYVLAGYKPYLWKDVFYRLKAFAPKDIDICVVSAGKYVDRLSAICGKNGWSYLSTTRNNICVISNIVLKLYVQAELVFKMDEDMYLTAGCFEKLEKTLYAIEEDGYKVGVVGPVVPLNSYCLYTFVEEHKMLDEYRKNFGEIYHGSGIINSGSFYSDSGVDSFIWNMTGNIDALSKEYDLKKSSYELCAVRYMIGFILYRKELWKNMHGFKVTLGKGSGEEGDEGQLISYCALNGRVFACVKNCLVGHFSFGGSEKSVLKLKNEHPEYFALYNK